MKNLTNYDYAIEHTNFKGRKSVYHFVAHDLTTVNHMCFEKFGSNYMSKCRLVSCKAVGVNEKI